MSLPVNLMPWVALMLFYQHAGDKERTRFIYAGFPTEKQCIRSAKPLRAFVKSEFMFACYPEDKAKALFPELFQGKEPVK